MRSRPLRSLRPPRSAPRVLAAAGAALATAGVLVAVPASTATAATAAGPGGPLVRTQQGTLRGRVTGGVDGFLGVRYAAPPTGARRWRPPAPTASWTGVRDARRYGPGCAQLGDDITPRSTAEDCLYLNVQRPAGLQSGARRPVFVWLHGGGFIGGSSTQYDMAPMVRANGIVGVTLNYRLGSLGFLAHPALDSEQHGTSGDYGFQDQQAALRWVQRNIAAFGGDPSQVTVGGESAGAFSTCGHLVAPGSAGLFSRAIVESGGCSSVPQRTADEQGSAFAKSLGCGDAATALACLRRLPPAKLIGAKVQTANGLVSGNAVLPRDPGQAVAAGRFRRVPVLVGANRDEGRYFMTGLIGGSESDYDTYVRGFAGPQAAAVLREYPWPAKPTRFTAAYLAAAVFTDAGGGASLGGFRFGGCVTQRITGQLSRHTSAYAYEFDHRTGPTLFPEHPRYQAGAAHATELPYLFPSFVGRVGGTGFDRSERRLAGQLRTGWGPVRPYRRPAPVRVDRVARVRPGREDDVPAHRCLRDGLGHRHGHRAPLRVLGGASGRLLTGRVTGPPSRSGRTGTAAPSRAGRYGATVSDLVRLLEERRSTRRLAGPVTADELAAVLWAVQGRTRRGTRTTPSAHATYPLAVTVVAGAVDGLVAGVHRYDPESGLLAGPAPAGDHRAAVAAAALADEAWLRDAAALLVLSADLTAADRQFADQPQPPRGRRYAWIEAGGAAQNGYLRATELGLGVVLVAGVDDEVLMAASPAVLPPGHDPLGVLALGRPDAGA